MFITMSHEFLGFSEDPFKITPDPEFFYPAMSHRQALTSMTYGIETRSGLISLTGDVGTGKTTLIHALLKRIDKKAKIVHISYSSITFQELLRDILSELEIPVEGKSKESLLGQLNEYLSQMNQDGPVVVIIDEAQNLSEEVLEDIGRMVSSNNSASMQFQIIFVGQPKFEEKLSSQRLSQLNERLRIRCQIKALNRKESQDYIEHRLKLVGTRTSKIFTPEAISMICSYSKGVPRTINILCDNALWMDYRLSKRRIDPAIIRKLIKNLEGPVIRKSLLSVLTTPLKGICPFTPALTSSFKRLSVAILLVLCMAGLVLVTYEYRQSRSTKTWGGKISLQSPHHVPLAAPSSSSPLEEDKTEETVIVKKGQTISSMAEQFYRSLSPTLVAFIMDCNPEVTNADFITVGQKIKMPKLTEESLILMTDHAYKINVGTFLTSDTAGLYRNEPALKGKEIEILPRQVTPKDVWYRIVVGNFNDKEEALKMTALLKEKELLPLFGLAPKK